MYARMYYSSQSVSGCPAECQAIWEASLEDLYRDSKIEDSKQGFAESLIPQFLQTPDSCDFSDVSC